MQRHCGLSDNMFDNIMFNNIITCYNKIIINIMYFFLSISSIISTAKAASDVTALFPVAEATTCFHRSASVLIPYWTRRSPISISSYINDVYIERKYINFAIFISFSEPRLLKRGDGENN